jgi:Fic family protein
MPYYKNTNNQVFWLDDQDSPVDWLEAGCVEISKEQADSLIEESKQASFNAMSYVEKRRMHYPPITDYLDGIVKDDQQQIQKYIADCLAVKTQFPKDQS